MLTNSDKCDFDIRIAEAANAARGSGGEQPSALDAIRQHPQHPKRAAKELKLRNVEKERAGAQALQMRCAQCRNGLALCVDEIEGLGGQQADPAIQSRRRQLRGPNVGAAYRAGKRRAFNGRRCRSMSST